MATTTTQRPSNPRAPVTEAAVTYFRERNRRELHRELRLKPWEWSPLEARDGPEPRPGFGWEVAQELRKALEESNDD